MNRIAAIPTGRAVRPPNPATDARYSLVEDLNWPVPAPERRRQPPRPAVVQVPGPNGEWAGIAPTMQ